MKRLTMSLDDELADVFEKLVRSRGYENRSEAFRDLLRNDFMSAMVRERPQTLCIATLSYVYNHHERQLAARLMDIQHEHHALAVSTMHAHLDHDRCVETVILRGRADEVQALAQSVITQRGVSHGQLHVVPLSQIGTAEAARPASKSKKRRIHPHEHE